MDIGRALHENYIYKVMLTLRLDKTKHIIECYSAEELVFFRVMKIMEVDFEAAVIKCKIWYFQTPLLLAVTCILISSCGHN